MGGEKKNKDGSQVTDWIMGKMIELLHRNEKHGEASLVYFIEFGT